MPRPDVAKLVADNLGNLPHPKGNIRFMHHSMFGLPDDQKQRMQSIADRTGEAFVHLVETNGYTISHPADPAPADPINKTVTIGCAACKKVLLTFTADENHQVWLNPASLENLTTPAAWCPHE
ncbi:Uncharacterised protein [Mycobacteroides abscessus subsp. abscessus]|uniref:hypothetical protein n=1 Tax=Mycobacteroides abscessus TaxID=36809 RepID=UPI00092663F4|nr:hypothetical protein [Mycobacteroides abscessus]SIC56048.1 Uncharacterised protein [Mycobacteroides abscessus subsp. abscessus]SKU57904.1 Uncharacterised protein [Mycobacteroides abscessus subsp. abscessus]